LTASWSRAQFLFFQLNVFPRRFLTRFKNNTEDTVSADVLLELPQETKSLNIGIKPSFSHSPLKLSELKPIDIKFSPEKPKPSVIINSPLRRSPRKCVRNAFPKVAKSTQTHPPRRNESKRLSFCTENSHQDANKPRASDSQSRLMPEPILASSLNAVSKEEIKDISGTDTSIKRQYNFTTSPVVTLQELPRSSLIRKRVRSYDATSSCTSPLSISKLSDSPLFRLRSFKRKVQEIGCVSPRSGKSSKCKRYRLAGESDLASSSNGTQLIFNSSRSDVIADEFEGF